MIKAEPFSENPKQISTPTENKIMMSEFNETITTVHCVMETMHAMDTEREAKDVKEEKKAEEVVSVARLTQRLVDNAMSATKRARNDAEACGCGENAAILKRTMNTLLTMSEEVLDDTMNSLTYIRSMFVAKKEASSMVLESACAAVGIIMTENEGRTFSYDDAGQNKEEAPATEAVVVVVVETKKPCLKNVERAMQLFDEWMSISEEVEKMKISVQETERAVYTAGSAVDALNTAKTEASSKVLSSGYSKGFWPNGDRLDKAMNAAIDAATELLEETRKKAEIAKEKFKIFSDDLISTDAAACVACAAAGIKPQVARSLYEDTYYRDFMKGEVDVPLTAAIAMMKAIEVGDNEDTECDEEEEPAPKRVCRTWSSCD